MSVEERVARLEEKAENTEVILKDIDKKVTDLSDQFLRYKGFIGGVIFTISAIWALILLAIDFVWKHK